jgi:hypothetical protein
VMLGSELKLKGKRSHSGFPGPCATLTARLFLLVVTTNLRKYPAVNGFCSGWQDFECLPLTFSFYSQEPSYLKATNDSTRRHDQAYPTSPQSCRQIHTRSSKSLTLPLLHIRGLTFTIIHDATQEEEQQKGR